MSFSMHRVGCTVAGLLLAGVGMVAGQQSQPIPAAAPPPPPPASARPPLVDVLYQAARARTDDETGKFLTQARTLLAQGTDVRAVDADGRNGLHWLSIASSDARRTRLGDTFGELTETLIEAGAEVGRSDNYGVMPLDWQPLAGDSAFVMVMQGQQAPREATRPLGDQIATLLARLNAMTAEGDLSGTRSTLDSHLPSQTTLSIRLTSNVGSRSLAGDVVDAVVTAPVMVGDRAVMPAGSTVRGTVLLARPARDRFHQSQLYVHFGQVRPLGTNEPSVLRTRVHDVDNAREKVLDGLIVGIPLPESKLQKVSWATATLGLVAPGSGRLLEALTAAFARTYSREIVYGPGVEMTLVVDMPQSLVERPENPRGWATFAPTPPLEEIVRGLPLRSTMTSGIDADVTNVVLLGSAADVQAAFAAAGWVTATSQNLSSDLKTFVATVEQHQYKHAPMFVLRLDGKDPDYVFQKQNDTFARRHHIRVYKRDGILDGQPVWAGAATHDIGIGVGRDGTSFFHNIEEQLDRERTKVLNDLMFSGKGLAYAMVDRPGVPPKLRNGTGDTMMTDGRVLVVKLGNGAPPAAPVR
ncbi:MAG TPA: LssY C-terminal domain-containing protein [Vicinamibacterales bacterium]|nr:LssY C-terminal domain-containing protein [Vicinamibacterales bacterium]